MRYALFLCGNEEPTVVGTLEACKHMKKVLTKDRPWMDHRIEPCENCGQTEHPFGGCDLG